jgi:beta-lactamase regulating signal transducer with metallopeptidase domain/cob(I)alamin adenosyltransferase
LAWLAGLAVFLLFACIKASRTNRWLRRQRKLLPTELKCEIEDLFSDVGVRKFPKVWLVEGIGQPFVWGLQRGSIYLPADFVKVNSAEHRREVLGHELSHVLRFDAAVNLLQIMAQAVFWFHPFVWWANKKIRAEREKCCDETAIARLGAKAKDYSTAIVEILACEHRQNRPVPSLAVAGSVRNVEERIKTMMKPGKKFYKRPSLVAATVALMLALLTVPTAFVLTARAETKAAPEHEEDLARDMFVQPTEREVHESREREERLRDEVEDRQAPGREARAREFMRHRNELQERASHIERELEGLGDDQNEEAHDLQAELRQIREKLRHVERELAGPERERREVVGGEQREVWARELMRQRNELQDRASNIERELKELGDREEAQELRGELHEIERRVFEIDRQLRGPEREPGRREEARLEELRHAIDRLAEQGKHEEADRLERQAHEIMQRLEEHPERRRPEAPGGGLERQVRQLRGEVMELRHEMQELRELLHQLLERQPRAREGQRWREEAAERE